MPTLDLTDEEIRQIIHSVAAQVPLIAKISQQVLEQQRRSANGPSVMPNPDVKQKQTARKQ